MKVWWHLQETWKIQNKVTHSSTVYFVVVQSLSHVWLFTSQASFFFFLERLLTTPAQHCPDPGQQRFPSVSFHKWRYWGSPVSARSQPLFPYLRKSAFSLDYKSSATTHYSVFLLFFLAARTIYFGFEGSLCPLVSFFVFYPPWLSVWRGRGTLNVNLTVMSWLELHKHYFSWTCTFCLLWLFV